LSPSTRARILSLFWPGILRGRRATAGQGEKPMLAPGTRRNLELAVLVLALAVAWNFWLPLAEDFYNDVTEANALRNRDLQNVDFFAYYLAGARFADGQNPYYFDQGQERLYAEYVYPPTYLPLYRALSRLPYDQARLLWLGLYLAGYAGLAVVVNRAALPEHRSTLLALTALLTFTSFPFLMHIHNGQSDVFVLILLLLGWTVYARGAWLPASILFALATLAKVNPALFLVYFGLYRRDARFALGFSLTCAAVGLASLAFVPASLYRDYLFDVLPQVTRGTAYWPNQSLLRFVPEGQDWLAPIVTAVGLGLFAWMAAWLGRRHSALQRQPGWPLGAGTWVSESLFWMNMAVILVLSGKAWSMAYVWMILPMALFLTYLLHQPIRAWYLGLTAAAALLLSSKIYGYPLLDFLNLLGSLLLLVVLGLWIFRRDQLLATA